jgi:hypothetical protein
MSQACDGQVLSDGWKGRHGECEEQHAEPSFEEPTEAVLDELP